MQLQEIRVNEYGFLVNLIHPKSLLMLLSNYSEVLLQESIYDSNIETDLLEYTLKSHFEKALILAVFNHKRDHEIDSYQF